MIFSSVCFYYMQSLLNFSTATKTFSCPNENIVPRLSGSTMMCREIFTARIRQSKQT